MIIMGLTFFVLEFQVLEMLTDAISASTKWSLERCISRVLYNDILAESFRYEEKS